MEVKGPLSPETPEESSLGTQGPFPSETLRETGNVNRYYFSLNAHTHLCTRDTLRCPWILSILQSPSQPPSLPGSHHSPPAWKRLLSHLGTSAGLFLPAPSDIIHSIPMRHLLWVQPWDGYRGFKN